jgi:hypothetical protein
MNIARSRSSSIICLESITEPHQRSLLRSFQQHTFRWAQKPRICSAPPQQCVYYPRWFCKAIQSDLDLSRSYFLKMRCCSCHVHNGHSIPPYTLTSTHGTWDAKKQKIPSQVSYCHMVLTFANMVCMKLQLPGTLQYFRSRGRVSSISTT